ncbi:MAG: FAD-dependent oxidoreductase [Candidatus Omnitrophica bacterium]|nr:FAD-dependent oxidoreductase [Candidatus Omnitrophota bacterium]
MSQPAVTTQPESKRVRNFNEVSLGFSRRVVQEESQRCLQCSDPVCETGCPLGVKIKEFIRFLREGHAALAYEKIREDNGFPSICGRLCHAPCESRCILIKEKAPIAIRALERYAADFGKSRVARPAMTGKMAVKAAVIGAGPAGLSAAYALAKQGMAATVFDAGDRPGGVLRYGVPDFRLPRKVLDGDIAEILAAGVELKMNCLVGRTVSVEDLLKSKFSAVLFATGAGVPKFMDVKGANIPGVYYGEEFLFRANLTKTNIFNRHVPTFPLGKKIAVIGSGNTALDCARAAIRFGLEVHLIFRRSEEEMRVRTAERVYGKEEGVKMQALTRPVEIIPGKNGLVSGIKCVRVNNIGDKMIVLPKSEWTLAVDNVVIAVGHQPNSHAAQSCPAIKINPDGSIWVDAATGMTTMKGVFACGNAVTNAGPVAQAIAAGKTAAENILSALQL